MAGNVSGIDLSTLAAVFARFKYLAVAKELPTGIHNCSVGSFLFFLAFPTNRVAFRASRLFRWQSKRFFLAQSRSCLEWRLPDDDGTALVWFGLEPDRIFL